MSATLAQVAQAARRAEAAAVKAAQSRETRDRLIVALAAQGVPHRVIAEETGLALATVGKITRLGGIQHWHRSAPRAAGEAAA
jgi:hypothetical protein